MLWRRAIIVVVRAIFAIALAPSSFASIDMHTEFDANSTNDATASVARWLLKAKELEGKSVELVMLGVWGLSDRKFPCHLIAHVQEVSDASASGAGQLRVTLSDAKASKPLGTIHWRVIDRRQIWIAASPLRKGEVLDCEKLRFENVAYKGSRRPWPGTCMDASKFVLRRPVESGDVLMESDLAFPAEVQAGGETMVSARIGTVEVLVTGVALADGFKGEMVPVRLPGKTGVLRATVVGPARAAVLAEER